MIVNWWKEYFLLEALLAFQLFDAVICCEGPCVQLWLWSKFCFLLGLEALLASQLFGAVNGWVKASVYIKYDCDGKATFLLEGLWAQLFDAVNEWRLLFP